jgi:hypothetical protein
MTGGVVGVVDSVLSVCQEHGLELAWVPGRCRVRSLAGDFEGEIDVPLRPSLFRPALDRVAILCNRRHAGSVSLWGGDGELTSEAVPNAIFRVSFVNTPEEQRLQLTPERVAALVEPNVPSEGSSDELSMEPPRTSSPVAATFETEPATATGVPHCSRSMQTEGEIDSEAFDTAECYALWVRLWRPEEAVADDLARRLDVDREAAGKRFSRALQKLAKLKRERGLTDTEVRILFGAMLERKLGVPTGEGR